MVAKCVEVKDVPEGLVALLAKPLRLIPEVLGRRVLSLQD